MRSGYITFRVNVVTPESNDERRLVSNKTEICMVCVTLVFFIISVRWLNGCNVHQEELWDIGIENT